MIGLKHLVRRALLAALGLLPLPAPAEVSARFDTASGTVVVSGLDPGALTAVLAGPEAVRLQVSGNASKNGMPLTVEENAGALVIAPRFALVPGTGYVLTLGERTHAIALPAPDAPAPRLTGFAPSQSTIPANTLRLYLQFSQPMARGQLRAAVTLTHSDGRPVDSPFLSLEAELWDPAQTRATLLLDPGRIKQGVGPNVTGGAPLQDGRAYRLTVAPDMQSAAGVSLGEAATIAFRAGPPERRAVDPADWQILAPPPGSQAPLTIAFDRIMDSGAVRRLIRLEGPGGIPVRGEIATDGGGWALTPDQPWTAGRYDLVVAPDLEDVAGNSVAAPFDAGPGTMGAVEPPAILTVRIGG